MGFVGAEVSNGLGRHKFYLEPGGYQKFLKYDYLDWAQVFATLALSKISICLFLLRLSSFRRLRFWLYALIIFLIVSHVPLFFLIVFQCSPIRKYWANPLEGPGSCFSKATVETIIIVQGGESFVLFLHRSRVIVLSQTAPLIDFECFSLLCRGPRVLAYGVSIKSSAPPTSQLLTYRHLCYI